jgi:hypothetical protein
MKPRSFLGKHHIQAESKDVRKNPLSVPATLKLARSMRAVHGVIGKKIISYDLKKDNPSDEELKKILIGRSGTMRAPCLQVDDVLVGGFDQDLYSRLLKL